MTRPRSVLVVGDAGRRLVLRVDVARSFVACLRGFLGRAPAAGDAALWLTGVRAIHTFGVRGPIDVVFVDARGRVLEVRPDVRPGRMLVGPPQTRHTVEWPPGDAARFGLAAGQRLWLAAAGSEP